MKVVRRGWGSEGVSGTHACVCVHTGAYEWGEGEDVEERKSVSAFNLQR